jgi:NADPH:quinone reductase-like Zn-dependent oxidoreductase
VCSTTKVDLVRTLGADRVIDYTSEDLASGGQRYDIVLDIGGRWLGGLDRTLRALALSPFVSQQLTGLVNSENAADLGVLADLIGAGKVTPVVDRTYPLSETGKAIRYLEEGHARGKVAITI